MNDINWQLLKSKTNQNFINRILFWINKDYQIDDIVTREYKGTISVKVFLSHMKSGQFIIYNFFKNNGFEDYNFFLLNVDDLLILTKLYGGVVRE